MAQPVTAILSHQGELADKARRFTDDANEASLLVGTVLGRAFRSLPEHVEDDAILRVLERDLDRLIAQMRRAQP
ncbi:MAG: hypothetical protein NVV62_02385 [Terricaulis sp.]|nr:hypothetical protein [Terricaulis sp.]